MFKNEIAFTSFELLPDSVRFAQLQGEVGRSNRLIHINCPNVSIKGPSLLKLYFDKVLEVDEFDIINPEVEVRVYGKFRAGSSGLRNFHEVLTKYLTVLRVGNSRLEHASVKFFKINDLKREGFEFNDISLSLERFKLDDRLEGDSLLSLGDMRISLGTNDIKVDSLNRIAFKRLDINIKDSTIHADSFMFKPLKLDETINQNDLQFKDLSILGIDFWQLYSSKNAKARQLTATEGAMKMSRAFVPDSIEAWNKISKLFDTIDIERIDVSNSSLRFRKLFGRKQNDITVPIGQATLHSFQLDSQSFTQNKLNLYSKNVDLALDPFSLTSKDSNQRIDVGALNLSTLNRELLLFDVGVVSLNEKTDKAKVNGTLKSVQVFGVDPMMVLQRNKLIARAVLLENPAFTITKGSGRSGFNNEVLNSMVKKQFRYVNVSNVQVENGNMELRSRNGYRETSVEHLTLFSKGFKTYSGVVPANKHLLSDAVNAEAGLISSYLPDGLHELRAQRSKLFTEKGGLYFDQLNIKLRESVPDSIAAISNIVREGQFVNMSIEGFDIDAFFNQSFLKVKNVVSKGENVLNMELNSRKKGKKPLWKIDIAELNMDSIDTRVTSSGEDELLMQINNTEVQLCDLRWDSTYEDGRFDIYSLIVNGNEVLASSKKSEHRLAAKQLKVNTAYGLFQLNGSDVRPLNDKFSGKTATWFSSNQFRFNGLDMPLFFKTRTFDADNFYCLNPTITHHSVSNEDGKGVSFLRDPFGLLSKYTGNITIDNLRIHQGGFKMYQYKDNKEIEYDLDEFTLYMKDFLIDSFTTHTDTNVFFAQESEIEFKSFERRANDTSMIISLGGAKAFPHKRLLQLEGIEVRNRKPVTSLKHVMLKSEKAELNGFNYHDFLINNRIRCDTVRFGGSTLTLGSDEKSTDKSDFFKRELPQALTKDYTSIRADMFYLDNATVNLRYKDSETRKIMTESIPGWDIECTYFNVTRNYERLSFLYSQRIKAYLHEYERELDDGLNFFYLNEGVFEPHSKKITLRNCSLTPKYEKMLYGRTYGKQIDRIQVDNPETIINGFDFEEWLYTGVYHMREITSKNTTISAFRDKTLEIEGGLYKPMPQETLRNLPFELNIGSITLEDWKISYEEQLGANKEPGIIEFHDFDADIKTINNIDSTDSIKVHIETRLMNEGIVKADLSIPNYHPEEEFEFNGRINKMDMREINPLLENLVGISIVSGKTDRMVFEGKADKLLATGTVTMYYSDLEVKLIDDKTDSTKSKISKGLIWLSNRVVSRGIEMVVRKGSGRFPKTGSIDFVRNREKSIFSYGAKALLSGIKASIGRRIINGGGKKKAKNGSGSGNQAPPDPGITGNR